MTPVLAPVAELLIQGATAVRDTVIMKAVPPDRGVLDRITEVASSLIAIALLTLTVVAVPVAFHSRRTYRKIHQLLDRVYDDVTPIMNHAHNVADNVNFITTSIRTDVMKVHETIDAANARVQDALALTERRMSELNALLSVVQEEAEHLFVSTASTVRGVREGAAAFRDRSAMDFGEDELDAADDTLADEIDIQEEGDGHDRNAQSTAPALPAAPRLRPRSGSQRRA